MPDTTSIRLSLVLVLSVLLTGLAAPAFAQTTENDTSPSASAESAESAASTPETAGEKLFRLTCATCHSVQPPAKLAPPMAMIMQRYRKALGSDDAIRATVLEWIPNPDKDRSLLPAMAIEHHGLMPPITTLSDEEMNQITDYLLTLKPEKGGMGGGMKEGQMEKMSEGMEKGKDKKDKKDKKHSGH